MTFSDFLDLQFKPQGGTSISEGWGGGDLGLTSSLESKFGTRSSQIHQIRGKTWEVLLPQDAKVRKNPNFGVISEIQRTKFNLGYLPPILLEAEFGAPTRISEANFGAKPLTS